MKNGYYHKAIRFFACVRSNILIPSESHLVHFEKIVCESNIISDHPVQVKLHLILKIFVNPLRIKKRRYI